LSDFELHTTLLLVIKINVFKKEVVIIGVVDDGENQVITTVILLNKTVENTQERPGISCVQKKVFTHLYTVAKVGVCMTK
jgi:hypothetical protein